MCAVLLSQVREQSVERESGGGPGERTGTRGRALCRRHRTDGSCRLARTQVLLKLSNIQIHQKNRAARRNRPPAPGDVAHTHPTRSSRQIII